jgi:hypothetical protein
MSDKVLARRTTNNPHSESEQASYSKEIWDLSRNRIRHALSQKRTATMGALNKSYLGNYKLLMEICQLLFTHIYRKRKKQIGF